MHHTATPNSVTGDPKLIRHPGRILLEEIEPGMEVLVHRVRRPESGVYTQSVLLTANTVCARVSAEPNHSALFHEHFVPMLYPHKTNNVVFEMAGLIGLTPMHDGTWRNTVWVTAVGPS